MVGGRPKFLTAGMDDQVLVLLLKFRDVSAFTSRTFISSLRSHPFLVGLLCFFVFLHRSSPFLFSLLVSASPVLLCTALLLGTLLCFGEPNIPVIQRDDKASTDSVPPTNEVSRDAFLIEESNKYPQEKLDDKEGVLTDQISFVATAKQLYCGPRVDAPALQTDERPRSLQIEDTVITDAVPTVLHCGYNQINDVNDAGLGYADLTINVEDLAMENDKSPSESFDSERVNVDSLDSLPGSPWKHEEEREEEEEESAESGSDQAESSSPDASMADITLMLAELHPLLEEDAVHPVTLSPSSSNAASERSLKTRDSCIESDDNAEKDERVSEDDADSHNDDHERGIGEVKAHTLITWTEEDQKNVMDLGSLELERNLRLESLIARRRARKAMNMAERNLIDFESAELPLGITPISTARKNPFDYPYNSYDDIGLPPIPGSAPSILQARRNPFDLPYDSGEEKPDLLGYNFQEELSGVLLKDQTLFPRHEGFSAGPSFLTANRLDDGQEGRLRPYIVTKRSDFDGTSSFRKASPEVSSINEADSCASNDGKEEKNVAEEKISGSKEPQGAISEMELTDSAEDLSVKISMEDLFRKSELASVEFDNCRLKEDVSQGHDLNPGPENVEHRSQASGKSESLELVEVEKRSIKGDKVELRIQQNGNDIGDEPFLKEEVGVAAISECVADTRNSSVEDVGEVYGSISSEMNEIVSKELSSLEGEREVVIKGTESFVHNMGKESHGNMDGSSLPPFQLDESHSRFLISIKRESESDITTSGISVENQGKGEGNVTDESLPLHILGSHVGGGPNQNSDAISPKEVLLVSGDHSSSFSTSSSREQSVDQAEDLQSELVQQGHSSFSCTNAGNEMRREAEVSAHNNSASEERLVSQWCDDLIFLDKSEDESSPSSEEDVAFMHEMAVESNSTQYGSFVAASEDNVSLKINSSTRLIISPTTLDSITDLSRSHQRQSAESYLDEKCNAVEDSLGGGVGDERLEDIQKLSGEGTVCLGNSLGIDDDSDDMKGFDESLLSELDAVGDFSIKELHFRLGSTGLETHQAPSSFSCASLPEEVNPNLQAVGAQSFEAEEVPIPFEYPCGEMHFMLGVGSSDGAFEANGVDNSSRQFEKVLVVETETNDATHSVFQQANEAARNGEEDESRDAYSSHELTLKEAELVEEF